MSWHQRPRNILILSAILPPAGLVLLWARRSTRVTAKLLGSLGLVALSVLYIHLLFGIRVEMAGSGAKPIISLYKPERHYERLEESRAEQREEPAENAAPAGVPQEAESTPEVAAAHAEAAAPSPAASRPAASARPYWTDFRGPRRDGRYDEMKILTNWPREGLPQLWRQPIGGGYASFVIANGKAHTIEQRRNQEVVTAYDVQTGRELWTHSWNALFRESMGGDGPRATPTWDEGYLYALGATGELRCLDAETGKRIWSRNILAENAAANLNWGMAASPLVVDEKLIVLPGGRSGNSVVAYHKRTGDPVWKSLSDMQAYASPMLATLAGERQILAVSAERVMGLRVEDGSLLWDYPWVTSYNVNATQPIIVGENRFFISSGYGTGAALVEISRNEGGFNARQIWKNNSLKTRFNTAVIHEGHAYGLDEGILACVDVETGERKWKGGRYGYGQVLLAEGHLIILAESGDVVLLKATPATHQELARFTAISGKTWNNPAISGGKLLVRNATEMAAFKISAP